MVYLLIIIIPFLGFLIFVIFRRSQDSFSSWWQFRAKGREAGFSFREIRRLRELADAANVPNALSVFQSRTAIDICIRSLVRMMRLSGEDEPERQEFLSKLYEYRKKIEIRSAAEKAGISSTHSDVLLRTQKRNSVRIQTHKSAFLYPIQDEADRSRFEVVPGLKCFIEDLSDTGCAVVLGGKAETGTRVKVQFVLDNAPLGISGTIRSVDYDEEAGRSLLHIEADPMPQETRNCILGEVFGMSAGEDDDFIPFRLQDEEAKAKQKTMPPP
jgi:hypothetical protein